MTREEIIRRLKALDDYEKSQMRNTWDDSDRVGDELLKILNARSKLQAMLADATDK